MGLRILLDEEKKREKIIIILSVTFPMESQDCFLSGSVQYLEEILEFGNRVCWCQGYCDVSR